MYRFALIVGLAGCSLLEVPPALPSVDAGVIVDAAQPPLDPCAENPCVEALKTQCSAVDGVAFCSCDDGARSLGELCLPQQACDDGDCLGGAMVLSRGLAVEGSLNRDGGDETDWFVLDLPSEGGVEALLVELIGDSGPDATRGEGEVPPLLPNMSIYMAPELERAARSLPRDGVQEDGRFWRIISLDVAPGSVLLLRLDDADELPINYRITALTTRPDDHADGEIEASAAQVGDQDFVLETREDTDVFMLSVESAGALLVSASLQRPGENAADISLRIGSLGGNDARRYYGRARHSVVPGDYLIRIDHRYKRLVSGQLHLRLLSDDDHGDRPEEATPIIAGSGQVINGSLEEGGSDWFAFAAQSSQVYRIVYEGTGILQARRVDDEAFVWQHAQGEYYRHDGADGDAVLELAGAAHDYRLMIMGSELEDPSGNRLSTALGLDDQLGDYEAGLQYRGDVDYFGPFWGEANVCLALLQGEQGLAIAIVDSEGAELSRTANFGLETAIEQSVPLGLYYLRAGASGLASSSFPMAYRFAYSADGCN
jgi:hypothetical protein